MGNVLFSFDKIVRVSRQIQPPGHKPLGQCPEQSVDKDDQQADGENRSKQGILRIEQSADIGKAGIDFNSKQNNAQQKQQLPDKVKHKITDDADQQPLLGKLPGKGAGQVGVQLGHGNQSKDQDKESQKERFYGAFVR